VLRRKFPFWFARRADLSRGSYEEGDPRTIDSLLAYWNFSDSTSLTMDGSNYVSLASDLSGNGHDLTSATTARPIYTAAITENGAAALRFDGTSDYMKSTSNLIGTDDARTIIAVVCNRRGTDYGGIVASTSPGTNESPSIVLESTTFGFRGSGGSSGGEITNVLAADTWAIYSFVDNGRGNTSYLFKDGAGAGSLAFANASSNISTETWVGTYRCNNSDWGQLDIAAIAIFSEGLSSADRTSVESYFSTSFID